MKRIFYTIIALVALHFTAQAQTANEKVLLERVVSLMADEKYEETLNIYKQLLVEAPHSIYYFQSAQLLAKLSRDEEALDYLEKYVTSDTVHPELAIVFNVLPEFENLRNTQKWHNIMLTFNNKVYTTPTEYNSVREHLEALYDADQGIRNEWTAIEKKYNPESTEYKEFLKKWVLTDKENLFQVQQILDEKGWLGKDDVGIKANAALFLVIQHAELDTQKKYLPMMTQAVKDKKANGQDLALLEDRIAMREKRKQVYGSQTLSIDGSEYVLWPVEDIDQVNERRKAVGLKQTLEEYMELVTGNKWSLQTYKEKLPALEKQLKLTDQQ
ncbi:DUF6624 domain-containing protein [Myroides phaeus]|uniref:DUF6624 domain-containing protein n=1 Tax=Myroides phaeus TaxID=702745 RepID=UPI001303429E|nr:DUF6624 domain-containing protein [Myroides phaeus]